MVRKIDGNKPTGAAGTTGIQPSKIIEGAKVGGVEQIRETQNKGGVGGVRRSTRTMTAEEQEHLFHLIDEEAEKLFGNDALPEAKRKRVTTSVKLAIRTGMVEDDQD